MRIGRLPEGFDSCTVKSECRSSGDDGTHALLLRALEDGGDSQRCAHVRPIPSHPLLHTSARPLVPDSCPRPQSLLCCLNRMLKP